MFWALTIAIAANEPSLPAMKWDWSSDQRFLIETEVQLPVAYWATAERNRAFRLMAFQLQTVLRCRSIRARSRWEEVGCTIEDVSLVGGAVPADRGRAQKVLDEYDRLLTDALMTIRFRADGHIATMDIPELPARNFRMRGRNELAKQIMRFAVMGLEVPLDAGGASLWVDDQAMLCTLTSTQGGANPVEVVHTGLYRSPQVEFASHGRGLVVTGGSANQYTCEITSRGFIDPEVGAISHWWEMLGEPTASSPVANGKAGFLFTQRGGLRRLKAGEVVDLQPTTEILLDDSGNLMPPLPDDS